MAGSGSALVLSDPPPATVDTDRLSVIGTTPEVCPETVAILASIQPRTVASFRPGWGG